MTDAMWVEQLDKAVVALSWIVVALVLTTTAFANRYIHWKRQVKILADENREIRVVMQFIRQFVSQSLVDEVLSAEARKFALICQAQERILHSLNQDIEAIDDSIVAKVNCLADNVKNAKENFWCFAFLAKTAGFQTKKSHKDYLASSEAPEIDPETGKFGDFPTGFDETKHF